LGVYVLRRFDQVSGRSFIVEIHDLTEGHSDPLDDYREVTLVFDDGTRYRSSCWRDPRAGDKAENHHWWEELGMIIVRDLTPEFILAAVDEIALQGAIAEAFEQE
jgi:hypothetical protein